jgi:hypothetical protein
MLMLAYRLSFILDIRVIGPKRAIYLYDQDLQLDLLMIFYPHLYWIIYLNNLKNTSAVTQSAKFKRGDFLAPFW